MSFLESLEHSQKEMLISLPYRVGLWISQSDDTGGAEADERELLVLSGIINGFASDVFGSEVIQYIMRETVNEEARWPAWGEDLSSVLSDCTAAVYLLGQHVEVEAKDVTAFQRYMMEIGEAVALAFREFEEANFVDKMRLNLFYLRGWFKAAMGHRSFKTHHEFMNISYSERQALQALAQALGTRYV